MTTTNPKTPSTSVNLTFNKCEQCKQLMYIKWICNTCSIHLCDPCKINHTKDKRSANHSVEALIHDESKCHQHLSETVQMYCLDCQHLVCLKCISETHIRHAFTEIRKVFEIKQMELKGQVTKLNNILEEDTKALQSVKKYEAQYTSAINASKKEINENNTKLKTDIDFLTTELLQKLNKNQAEKISAFQKQSRTIEKRSEKLKTAVNNAEHHLKSKDQIAVIKYVSVMDEILQQSKSLKVLNEVPPSYHLPKYDHDNLRPLIGSIDSDDEKASECEYLKLEIENLKTQKPYQTKVIASFQLRVQNDGEMCIAATPDGDCWIKQDNEIVLMSANGKIKNKTGYCGSLAITVNHSGELIIPDDKTQNIQICDKQGKYKQDLLLHSRFHSFTTVCISVTRKNDMLLQIYTGNFEYVWISNGFFKAISYLHKDVDKSFFGLEVLSRLKDNGDICVLPATGELIVCNSFFQKRFTYTGVVSQDGQTGTPKQVRQKSFYKSLEVDTAGHILLGDVNNSTVELIDGEGNFIQYLLNGKDGLQNPTAMSLRMPGLLWVYSKGNNKMFVVEYKN